MTASTLTHLPLAAGGAVAASAGRLGVWAVGRYMRAPLANTGMIVFATFTAMAGSNALYNQAAMHPAPFFAPAPNVPEAIEPAQAADVQRVPDPVPEPASRPETASVPALPPVENVSTQTTGSVEAAPAQVAPVVPSEPVGNADVFAVQKKLLELNLFEGDVDGYYGPMTARAIRSFEEQNGMEPLGAMSPEIVEAILKADASGRVSVPVAAAAVAVRPAPAAARPEIVATNGQPDVLIGRVQEDVTIESVIASATHTIDSLVAAVDSSRTTPTAPDVKPVPALPLLAEPSVAERQQMPPAVQPTTVQPTTVQATAVVATPADTRSAPAQSRQPVADTRIASTEPIESARPAVGSVVPSTNESLVTRVQRGLASLGFLHGAIDGEANEATARAIRNFEVYHNYPVTGAVTPQLVDMLTAAGASI